MTNIAAIASVAKKAENGFTCSESTENSEPVWTIRDSRGLEICKSAAVRHAYRILDLLNAA